MTSLVPTTTSPSSTLSVTLSGAAATNGTDPGLPKGAIVGIAVVGVAVIGVIGFVIAKLIRKSSAGYHHSHHHRGDNHEQEGSKDQGGARQHGLEPSHRYDGDYNHMQHMDHQGIPDQGVAHQGSSGQEYLQYEPTNQGTFNQPHPTSTPGNGILGHTPTPGGPIQQSPIQYMAGGTLPLPTHDIHDISSGLPPLVHAPPIVNRPVSSARYSLLQPSSPTNTTFSADSGTTTIAPLPLDYKHSTSPHGSCYGGGSNTWDENAGQEFGHSPQTKQALLNQAGYVDANSSRHYSSRVLPPRISTVQTTQFYEVRSPQDRCQFDAIESHEVRSPQDRCQSDTIESHEVKSPQGRRQSDAIEVRSPQETIGSTVSTGNVLWIKTLDQRHPQSDEGTQGADM
ncbi:hypothetical protein BGX26_005825 [Mortierella sp. AD094]|nr:hypothetical protein BGX26_005825 [Mortierella sp. AD094]